MKRDPDSSHPDRLSGDNDDAARKHGKGYHTHGHIPRDQRPARGVVRSEPAAPDPATGRRAEAPSLEEGSHRPGTVPLERNTAGDVPPGLRSPEQIEGAARQVLCAPPALPLWREAVSGLIVCLSALKELAPQATAFIRALQTRLESWPEADPTASARDDRGLHDSHGGYFAALTVGWLQRKGKAMQIAILQILGLQFLRTLIRGMPRPHSAFAPWRLELMRTASTRMASDADVKRAVANALKALHEDARTHLQRSIAFGFARVPPRQVRSKDPEDQFNARLRARRSNQERHASDAERAGAGGRGAASSGDVNRNGEQLLAGIEDGHLPSITAYLAVIGNLSEGLALEMLVQLGSQTPSKALTWVDLPRGDLCSRLDKVIQKGRRASDAMEQHYLPTTQVVRRRLSTAVVEELRKAAIHLKVRWIALGKLLGAKPVGQRYALDGSTVGGITTRKLQRGLAAHLISHGHHRWLVSLVLSQPVLVPPAREFYAACRTKHLDQVNAAVHGALGMPMPPLRPVEGQWVGAFVAVGDGLVQAVVRTLSNSADRAEDWTSVRGLAHLINRHAEYLALLLEVGLALREWAQYQLSPYALTNAPEISFCDKRVHEDPEAPLPVVSLLRQACARWLVLLSEVCRALRHVATQEAGRLADLLESEATRRDGTCRVTTVGPDGRLRAVGHQSWRQRLPRHLQVEANFARHFWPLVLIDEGVPQRLIDVFMRQQLKNLHAGTRHRDGIARADREFLAAAIERVLSRLDLQVPRGLRECQQ